MMHTLCVHMHGRVDHNLYISCLVQEDMPPNPGHEPVDHNQVTRGDLELAATFRERWKGMG